MPNRISTRFGTAAGATPVDFDPDGGTTRTTAPTAQGAAPTSHTYRVKVVRKAGHARRDVSDVRKKPRSVPLVVLVDPPRPVRRTDLGAIEVGWDGVPLGRVVTVDAETEKIAGPWHVPRPAMLAAYDGDRSVVIPPEQIGSFVLAHRECEWVIHNCAFDFWVIVEHLGVRGEHAAAGVMFELAAAGQIHDTMILHQLVVLATTGEEDFHCGLADLVSEFRIPVAVDKAADERYRLNYHALVGQDLARVGDDGWFVYPVKDVMACHAAFRVLYERCSRLIAGPLSGSLTPGFERWGLLGETIQVQGAVALARLEHNGLHVDAAYRVALNARLGAQLVRQCAAVNDLVAADPTLAAAGGGETLYVHDAGGHFLRTPTGGVRSRSKVLAQLLAAVRDAVSAATGQALVVPLTERAKQPTTAADFWTEWRESHPFLIAWLECEQTTKLIRFTANPDPIAYSSYRLLTSTGRTSSSGPNLQNVPRSGGVREMFVPSPGHVLLSADYSQIELRTLAAICLATFGYSRLAEVFREGQDPHTTTAASILGLSPADVVHHPDFKRMRQAAKAINFGVPGGMGGPSLADYARASYGVTLTPAEADRFRDRLIHHVYPELADYLQDRSIAQLAANLGVPYGACRDALGLAHSSNPAAAGGRIRRIARGERHDSQGRPYPSADVAAVWSQLQSLCRNPELMPTLLGRSAGDPAVGAKLFAATVCTLTGRARAGCSYTQARNTPFQALAADGAKIALFELTRRGWRVVAFIHDEILAEVPVGCDYDAKAAELVDVMVSSMSRVCPGVAIACGDPVLMTRWSKDAEVVRDEQGRLVPWSPPG